jgi:integrase/recombinase XerD
MSTDLRVMAVDYLDLRRGLGYKLADHHWLIAQFLDDVAERGSTVITTSDALAFAAAPATTTRRWHATWLEVIRGFCAFVHACDPAAAEIIPPKMIRAQRSRRIPYLYSEEQVCQLMAQAQTLHPAMFGATIARVLPPDPGHLRL